MNKDQVEGRLKKAGGKFKEIAGKLVGNKFLEQKGRNSRVAGIVQAGYGDLRNKMKKIG